MLLVRGKVDKNFEEKMQHDTVGAAGSYNQSSKSRMVDRSIGVQSVPPICYAWTSGPGHRSLMSVSSSTGQDTGKAWLAAHSACPDHFLTHEREP